MPKIRKIKVLIADAHTVTRAGLKGILHSARDICVVGEVENLQHAPLSAKRLSPRVVIVACFESQELDVALRTIQNLKDSKRKPKMWVVFIGSDTAYGVARQAGADDALSQHLSVRELREAVRNCHLLRSPVPRQALDATTTTRSISIQVKRYLESHFSLSELADLSFELGIDFDDITGDDRLAKVRNLVLRFEHEGRIRKLEAAAHARRSKAM